jgi:hypothetical protein
MTLFEGKMFTDHDTLLQWRRLVDNMTVSLFSASNPREVLGHPHRKQIAVFFSRLTV